MSEFADRAWVQQEINDLSDLVAGTRWAVIAVAFAAIEAKAIDRLKLLETIDHFIDFARMNGTDAEVVPLETVRTILEEADGPVGLTGSIELANLMELHKRLSKRRGGEPPAEGS